MNLQLSRGRMGEGIVRGVWDGHVYTAIFKMGNQPTKPLLYIERRDFCSKLRGSLDGSGVWGGGNGYMFMHG